VVAVDADGRLAPGSIRHATTYTERFYICEALAKGKQVDVVARGDCLENSMKGSVERPIKYLIKQYFDQGISRRSYERA